MDAGEDIRPCVCWQIRQCLASQLAKKEGLVTWDEVVIAEG